MAGQVRLIGVVDCGGREPFQPAPAGLDVQELLTDEVAGGVRCQPEAGLVPSGTVCGTAS